MWRVCVCLILWVWCSEVCAARGPGLLDACSLQTKLLFIIGVPSALIAFVFYANSRPYAAASRVLRRLRDQPGWEEKALYAYVETVFDRVQQALAARGEETLRECAQGEALAVFQKRMGQTPGTLQRVQFLNVQNHVDHSNDSFIAQLDVTAETQSITYEMWTFRRHGDGWLVTDIGHSLPDTRNVDEEHGHPPQ